jgi:hypothetical protein
MGIVDVKKIDKTLQGLPLDDRIGALIMSLCSCGVDSAVAIQRLIATAGILGQNLPSEVDRRCCATILRDCAVEVEADYRPLKKR